MILFCFLRSLAFHCKSLYNRAITDLSLETHSLRKNVSVRSENKKNPDVCISTESPRQRGKIDRPVEGKSKTVALRPERMGPDQRAAWTFMFAESLPPPYRQWFGIRCRSIFHLSHLQPIGLMVGSGAWLANKEAGRMELLRRALRW